jgi:hypothetical protein
MTAGAIVSAAIIAGFLGGILAALYMILIVLKEIRDELRKANEYDPEDDTECPECGDGFIKWRESGFSLGDCLDCGIVFRRLHEEGETPKLKVERRPRRANG